MAQVLNRLRRYLRESRRNLWKQSEESKCRGRVTPLLLRSFHSLRMFHLRRTQGFSKISKYSSFLFIFITLLVGSIFTPAQATPAEKEDEAVNLKVLEQLADNLSTLLISARGIIALSQELINKDPLTGNFYFKGLVPIVVGRMTAENFYIRTGIHIKQTSLKLRNPEDAPDKWEAQVLKNMESPDYPKGKTYSEVILPNGKKVYRYMKPLYIEEPCLPCHLEREKIPQYIRTYLEEHYPTDEAVGYKLGDLRGAISITIPLNEQGVVRNKEKK